MSLFSRRRPDPDVLENSISDASAPESQGTGSEDAIAGDRGIPLINRARSIQSRVSSLLAISLMSVLGLGFLSWYYLKVFNWGAEAQHAAQAAIKNRAQGEMALPDIPQPAFAPKETTPPPAAGVARSAVEKLLGSSPPPPPAMAPIMPVGVPGYPMPGYPMPPAASTSPQKSAGELALERRLAGPAFAHASSEGSGTAGPTLAMPAIAPGGLVSHGPVPPAGPLPAAGEDSSSALTALLRSTVTPAVPASVLPTRRFLLAKGTFIDCTLETAIDSTLPGMTTCVTATDTFSADGSVVLLERGTKLVGETRGQVAQGTSRLFVLWTEARTPTGVVVPLSSPGTDELGRSGLEGQVNRHFWDRFGAAILLTVINGAVQGAVQSQNSGSSVVVSPSSSSDVMTELLKSTVGIAPTVTKAQGARIQVFVARDVDFRPVYALEVSRGGKSPEGLP